MERERITEEFLSTAIYRLTESSRMIGLSMEKLGEHELWQRPNNISNSVGNLILHLCGNIRQYILSSLGGEKDVRARPEEFSASPGYTKAVLMEMLGETVEKAVEVIRSCPGEELLRPRQVQGFELSGIGIIMHVVEHYSYHTGQIAYFTKLSKGLDLHFYSGRDLNIHNQ